MIEHKKDSYTFASVAYANAAPMTTSMQTVCPDSQVIYDAPSRLAERLLQGTVDAALIPVVDLFANPSLEMIDHIGICADGNVTSVLLKCYRPLKDIRTIAKDPCSHTSNALAAILMKHHFNVAPEFGSFSESQSPNAKIVIGDKALCSSPAPHGDYDLAGEWKTMTGLPFVFAVWACRNDCPYSPELARILQVSLEKGREMIDQLADAQAQRLGIPLEQCKEYLTNIIQYHLGQLEIDGMNMFKQMLATDHGDQS